MPLIKYILHAVIIHYFTIKLLGKKHRPMKRLRFHILYTELKNRVIFMELINLRLKLMLYILFNYENECNTEKTLRQRIVNKKENNS